MKEINDMENLGMHLKTRVMTNNNYSAMLSKMSKKRKNNYSLKKKFGLTL